MERDAYAVYEVLLSEAEEGPSSDGDVETEGEYGVEVFWRGG